MIAKRPIISISRYFLVEVKNLNGATRLICSPPGWLYDDTTYKVLMVH